MTPTTFTAPAPVATSALPAAAPNAPLEPAPADFLLMLGQLVASSAEAPAIAAALADVAPEIEPDTEETGEEGAPAELFSMLPLALPLPATPVVAQNARSDAGDMILELQLSRGGAAAAQIPALMQEGELHAELLDAPLAPEQIDASTPFDTALAAHTSKESLQTSRPMTADVSRPVHSPVGSSAWADDIGARVTMMAKHGEQTASLRLSPEHLGPLEIRVAIRDDQASVWFGAAHADTRAAIENALPRLRELFESQGMSLTDAGVFQGSPREQAMAHSSVHGSTGEELAPESQVATNRTVVGLIDAYA